MMSLSLMNFIVTSAMTGILWLIQIVHYPMFEGLAELDFLKWHEFHSRRITYIVGPLMVLDLLVSIYLSYLLRSPLSYLAAALTIFVWLMTFLVSVPLHTKLGRSDRASQIAREVVIARLVATNWPRTIAYSLKLIVLFLSLR